MFPRGRQQRGILELVRVLESRDAARGRLCAPQLGVSLSATGSTEFWGTLQHAAPPCYRMCMPCLHSCKQKRKNVVGLFFLHFALCCVLGFFFLHILPLSPVVPRRSSLPQKINAIIISSLISLSKSCNGAPRPSQRHPQNKRRAIRGQIRGI